jgi:predicted dehydrogenase
LFGVSHYKSISSLLSSPDKPSAAIVCTSNDTHVPVALELIAAGIHVLIEKPLSTTVPEGLAIIAAARENGVKVLVGHHRRFNPHLLSAKQCVDSGSLGRIVAVQGSCCLQEPHSYFDGVGEYRRNRASGGVILAKFINEVDVLQYLLGPIVAVSAFEAQKTRDFEAEEGAAIILRFENKTVGTFVLSDSVASPWAFGAGIWKKEDGVGGFCRIMGTRGSLSIPDLTRWSYDEENSGVYAVLKQEEVEVDKAILALHEQMKHFIGVVTGEQGLNCTGEEALRAMVVCEAVKQAMDTGKQMEIIGFEVREL